MEYLTRVQPCERDWIVYPEPSKVRHTNGCFAIAKVQEVIPDPREAVIHLAVVEPGTYLDFVEPVPFRYEHEGVEQGLLNDFGEISGRVQAAVRAL